MTIASIEADTIIRHIGQLVTLAQQPLPHVSGPLQIISNAAIAVRNGRITWIGSDDEVALLFTNPGQEITTIDAGGVVVTGAPVSAGPRCSNETPRPPRPASLSRPACRSTGRRLQPAGRGRARHLWR